MDFVSLPTEIFEKIIVVVLKGVPKHFYLKIFTLICKRTHMFAHNYAIMNHIEARSFCNLDLQYAIRLNSIDLVKTIIPFVKNNGGYGVTEAVAKSGNIEIYKLVIDTYKWPTNRLFFRAAGESKNLDFMRYLYKTCEDHHHQIDMRNQFVNGVMFMKKNDRAFANIIIKEFPIKDYR